MSEIEIKENGIIKVSELMKNGLPKRTLKFLEEHQRSTLQDVLANKIVSTREEARIMVNALRNTDLVIVEKNVEKSKERIHLFSAFIFTKDTLPPDINERIKKLYNTIG